MVGKISEPKVFYTSVVGVLGFVVYGLVKTIEGYSNTFANAVPTEEVAGTPAAETSEENNPTNEKKSTKKAPVSENPVDAK